ncbi:MAG: hypothetical protein ACXWJX_06590 [Limisphaerales bacterium]
MKRVIMIPKYIIEYKVKQEKGQIAERSTDDPVACEEFLQELLERREPIVGVKHEGVELPPHEFDKMVRNAAAMLAGEHICASLKIKPEEEKYRFGFTA